MWPHVNPLGADYNLWKPFWRQIEHRDPPAFSVKNVEALKTFWRWHIELAKRNHLEEIWLIGFRGNGDHPFWYSFQDSPPGDKERASLIESMMQAQVALVKDVTGETAPIMRTTLYNEMSDFYAAGLLRPPVELNLIWTFVAARRDHYPAPDAQKAVPPPNQPLGYYMNFQFTSTGARRPGRRAVEDGAQLSFYQRHRAAPAGVFGRQYGPTSGSLSWKAARRPPCCGTCGGTTATASC